MHVIVIYNMITYSAEQNKLKLLSQSSKLVTLKVTDDEDLNLAMNLFLLMNLSIPEVPLPLTICQLLSSTRITNPGNMALGNGTIVMCSHFLVAFIDNFVYLVATLGEY